MGLDSNAVKALLFAKACGVDFSRTLMVGRQHLIIDVDVFANLLK